MGVIVAPWRVLWAAARAGTLATAGPYAWVRHPQYAGSLAVMDGFLLQWPTLPTLVMFPSLVIVYRRLASSEERSVRRAFRDVRDDSAEHPARIVACPPAKQRPAPPNRQHTRGQSDRPE